MRNLLLASCLVAGLLPLTCKAQALTVPATADLELSGWPDGTTAWLDTAPAQSPVLVTNIRLHEGAVFSFEVTGSAARDFAGPYVSADGYYPAGWTNVPAANGISGMDAPLMALAGVFLSDALPDTNATPPASSFVTSETQNRLFYRPYLNQQFFIGDGTTAGGRVQAVVAPPGATRLFLGISDNGHYNNLGGYSVSVTQTVYSEMALYAGITLYGEVGSTIKIEYVTDLVSTNWQTLTTVTIPSSPYLYIDLTSPMPARRFYRATQ